MHRSLRSDIRHDGDSQPMTSLGPMGRAVEKNEEWFVHVVVEKVRRLTIDHQAGRTDDEENEASPEQHGCGLCLAVAQLSNEG